MHDRKHEVREGWDGVRGGILRRMGHGGCSSSGGLGRVCDGANAHGNGGAPTRCRVSESVAVFGFFGFFGFFFFFSSCFGKGRDCDDVIVLVGQSV